MADLFDLAPTNTVIRKIGGKDIALRALPLRIILDIVASYPAAVAMLRPQDGAAADATFTPMGIAKLGKDAVERVIAAGTGHIDDPKALEFAGNLELEVQLELIDGIIEATAPRGTGPLWVRVRAMQARLGLGVDVRQEAMPSEPSMNSSAEKSATNGQANPKVTKQSLKDLAATSSSSSATAESRPPPRGN